MIIFQAIGILYVMWLGYVLAMHIIAKWDGLPFASKVLGFPAVAFAFVLDVVLNWTIVALLFLKIPRDATITKTLHRYQKDGGWRAKPAKWVCTHLLNPFDAEHC